MRHSVLIALAMFASAACALDAPNVVALSPRLVTSGQPDARALASLRDDGFAAVIYLVPPNAHDAVATEPELLRAQGIDFTQVPIDWERPTDADFDAFASAMNRLRDRKVLVHCQINLRASTMTFLYRAIVQGEPAEKAYEGVASVWSPNATWKRYVVAQLARANVRFEPY